MVGTPNMELILYFLIRFMDSLNWYVSCTTMVAPRYRFITIEQFQPKP